jgi:hypothetical protein
MINRLKTIQLQPTEFLWKFVIVFLFGVPVPILGLGLAGWYISVHQGMERPLVALITGIGAVLGTVIVFGLVAWIISIGKSEKKDE